jgi:hypothetical protein
MNWLDVRFLNPKTLLNEHLLLLLLRVWLFNIFPHLFHPVSFPYFAPILLYAVPTLPISRNETATIMPRPEP